MATSDALNEWKIENVAVRVNTEQLSELPTPFLTYLHMDYGIFALVTSINGDIVEWQHTKKGLKREKKEDFLKIWKGVVFKAEINEKSGEKDYHKNRKREILNRLRMPFLLMGISLLIISLLYHNFTTEWYFNTLLITKLIGLIVSCLLLWQSIDQNNPFIKNLCQVGNKISCNAILTSKAAQVTSWLSWSEVGFFYFVGGFISLLNPSILGGGETQMIPILGLLSILALPYTIWSVYYQAFVAKQWCTLCLIIQGLFILEFLIYVVTFSKSNNIIENFKVHDSVVLLLGFGVAVMIWAVLKPLLQKSQQIAPLKNDLKRFKNNPNLFLSMLQKQIRMPHIPHNLNPIIIGSLNAEYTITMITNPFCQPCAKTHSLIEELLESTENLNYQVIFSVDDNDRISKVARLIMSLPKSEQGNALHDWFKDEDRDIEKWQNRMGITENETAKETIAEHQIWCKTAKFQGTPTLYINGYEMPDLYLRSDLKVILKYLPTQDLQIEYK